MAEVTGCVYPDYLQDHIWSDKTTFPAHHVEFKNKILNTHQNQIIAKINWRCFHVSREGTSDLVVSRAELFGQEFFRCELYHKADAGHVYYKSLQDPYHHVSGEGDRCNICSKKEDAINLESHLLESEDKISPPPNTAPNFGCGASQCDECPVAPVRALKDEARSLEYILRQWLADKTPEK
ncbi:hypothetical protein KP79_PYT12694 [Mizuhopecten yessoensis]|uniref:Uncharacterized protein n=2 Tax=Mizuhopecten yessoensis TaxID=6573 RepID=A0A210PLB4_MIZYE|nr:hypothetical protein KP79_PYT12694 [Mizuhopecten yessoensis]